jgi:uncharacterized membrane protein YkvA (DUF1232 family)
VDTGLIVGVVVAVIGLWILLVIVLWLLRPKGMSLGEVVRLVPDVLRLLRSVGTDASAPLDVRLVVGVLFLWIISPIDLIPELIPVIGPVDDVIVAAIALRYIRRRLGNEGLRSRWQGSADGFALLTRLIGFPAG